MTIAVNYSKTLNKKEKKKILFFFLNFMRLLEHSHFIITHRNLIFSLCYYRYSSLEYGEERSFYDLDDNSFLFLFSSSTSWKKKKRVKFISFPPFFFFFSLLFFVKIKDN